MQKLFSFVFILAVLFLGYQMFFPSETDVSEDDQLFEISEPKEVSTDLAILNDVTGGESEGSAQRSYKEGVFFHSLRAVLPPLEDGFVYEGWLMKSGESPEVLQTGVLTLLVETGEFELEFIDDRDFMDYGTVFVTLESLPVEGEPDHEPGEKILEGTF